jgi:hypothetical protein
MYVFVKNLLIFRAQYILESFGTECEFQTTSAGGNFAVYQTVYVKTWQGERWHLLKVRLSQCADWLASCSDKKKS